MTRDAGRDAWAGEVDQALRALDGDEELFIRLNYFLGLDQARIADGAGVSLAVVARSIATGLRGLGRALENLRLEPPAAMTSPTSHETAEQRRITATHLLDPTA